MKKSILAVAAAVIAVSAHAFGVAAHASAHAAAAHPLPHAVVEAPTTHTEPVIIRKPLEPVSRMVLVSHAAPSSSASGASAANLAK